MTVQGLGFLLSTWETLTWALPVGGILVVNGELFSLSFPTLLFKQAHKEKKTQLLKKDKFILVQENF